MKEMVMVDGPIEVKALEELTWVGVRVVHGVRTPLAMLACSMASRYVFRVVASSEPALLGER